MSVFSHKPLSLRNPSLSEKSRLSYNTVCGVPNARPNCLHFTLGSSAFLSCFKTNYFISPSRDASASARLLLAGRKCQCLLSPSLKVRTRASLATADICDSNVSLLATGELRVLQTRFQMYGQHISFSGPVKIVKVLEDNVLVTELISMKGEGNVLVIDGGGSRRTAVMGGKLAKLAKNNGWAGVIVNGCIRDVDEINALEIGVRALGSNPIKPGKKGNGEKHVSVNINWRDRYS